jgi:hypothetical protein
VLQALRVQATPEAEAPEAAARDRQSSLPSARAQGLLLDVVLEVYDRVHALIQHLTSGV